VISNRQRRVPAFALVIEDRVIGADGQSVAAGRAFAIRVGPGESELRTYRLLPERRGELRFVGFNVFTRFPFGLFSKALSLEVPESTLVYPKVEPVEAMRHLGPTRQKGEGRSAGRGSGALVAGLRDWEPGDALRRVHWPSSLRRGSLSVREQEHEEQTEVEVQLRTAGERSGDAFERSVGWAASEVVAFLQAGSRVGLRTDSDRLPAGTGLAQRGTLLAFLARVAPGATETA
jgi:uncharacterized protein (DUF58 family)